MSTSRSNGLRKTVLNRRSGTKATTVTKTGSGFGTQVNTPKKAANITIYAVQVNTGGDPTSAVLQYCAQNTSSFYLVTSASQTASVFTQIGTQLTKLRVLR